MADFNQEISKFSDIKPTDDPIKIFDYFYKNISYKIIALLTETCDIKNPIINENPLIISKKPIIINENPIVAFSVDSNFKQFIDILSSIYKGNIIITDKEYKTLEKYGVIRDKYVSAPNEIITISKICNIDIKSCDIQELNFIYDIIDIYFDRFHECLYVIRSNIDDYIYTQHDYLSKLKSILNIFDEEMKNVNPNYLDYLYVLNKNNQYVEKLYNLLLFVDKLDDKVYDTYAMYYEQINYIYNREDLITIRDFVDEVIVSTPHDEIKKNFKLLKRRYETNRASDIYISGRAVVMFKNLYDFSLQIYDIILYAIKMHRLAYS